MRIFALMIAALLTLSACQTTENIGSGSISDMSERTINGYRNYLRVKEENEHYNMAFAYNRSARAYGWSGTHQQHGIGYTIKKAMENCEKANPAGECKVFDIDGQIVWTGLEGGLIASLLEPLPVIYDTQTYEYDAKSYRISAAQLKIFKRLLVTTQVAIFRIVLRVESSCDSCCL